MWRERFFAGMASKFLNSQTVKATVSKFLLGNLRLLLYYRIGCVNVSFIQRGFAAQAAAKSSPAAGEFSLLPREPVKTTTLNNGIVVSSVETNAPLSRVGIAFKYFIIQISAVQVSLKSSCMFQGWNSQ